MTKISILPNKVWKVAVSTAKDYPCFGSVALGNIADDDERGIKICMRFDSGSVFIYVMQNETVIYERETNSADECEATVKEVLKKYLSYSDEDDEENSEEFVELDDDEIEDVITEREDWLDQATMDFLDAVIGEDFEEYDADTLGTFVEDCKNHFVEYLARKFSVPVFRPMYLEDVETGEDFYTEYPYEDMVFDDEDNPIYK